MQGSNKLEKFGNKNGRQSGHDNEPEYCGGNKKKKKQDRCAIRDSKRSG